MGIKKSIGGSVFRRQETNDVKPPVIFVYFLLPTRLLLQNHEIADKCSQSHSLSGKHTVFQILTISSQCSCHNYLKNTQPRRVATAPRRIKKNKTRLTTIFSFADGVGDDQQSGLRRSHVPQHERLGLGVEAGNLLSLQLLAQVSTPPVGRARSPPASAARW